MRRSTSANAPKNGDAEELQAATLVLGSAAVTSPQVRASRSNSTQTRTREKHHMSGGTHKCSASNAINENDHEDPMSALVAMAVLAGIAAPASAAGSPCAPGYAQAYDHCIMDGGGGS